MKKMFIFLLCITAFVMLPACSNKTTEDNATTVDQTDALTEDDANDIGSLPLVYAPFFFKDDNVSIVEFGEKCEWLDDFPYPDGKSCFTINYIDVFEFTYRYSNQVFSDGSQVSNVSELKNNIHLMPFYEESFKYIKNSNQLKETYDDIVMVSDFQAENIKSGDTYIIAYALTGVEKWDGEEQIIRVGYKDVTRGYMYPVSNNCLNISDMFNQLYIANPDKTNYIFHDLLRANELVSQANPDFPIFKSGASISDIKAFFEYGTELLLDDFWKEIRKN